MYFEGKNYFHLAGLVPVAGQPLNFNLPWHDSCIPIAQNYLAIERAVVECAYAGCETIWIVCHDDMQPLIRYRLGDYINDPVWVARTKDTRPSESKKQIPIFYVPIHPKDRDKRDCLAWSILYGAMSAYNVGKQISIWTVPDKYYIAFPYGVYSVEFLRQHRNTISSDSRFLLTFEGQSVKQNEYLGFTFNNDDFVLFRKLLRERATGQYISNPDGGIPKQKLPLEERYSARFFNLAQVFEPLETENSYLTEIPWYYKIDNWENYCEFLASENSKDIKRPPKSILSYHEFNKIGQENYTDES